MSASSEREDFQAGRLSLGLPKKEPQMKSYLQFFKLPKKYSTVLTEQGKLERISKRFAAALKRFVGTGERLRAT